MGEKIQLGLIGAGAITKAHLDAFSQLPEVSLAGIADVNRSAAEERAEEYGIGNVYSSADELIGDSQVDAVIVCVPNMFHAPLAIQALQAGKHVLLEKPMSINAKTAAKIIEAERSTDQVLMMAHQRRWDSIPMQVKELAEQGRFGSIYHAKASWMRRKGIPGWGSWFTQKEKSGGGPLIDIGVHMLDLSLHLMGNPRPVSVYGATYAEFGPKRRGLGRWGTPDWNGVYDVEDFATALIKMDNGSTLSLDVSWAAHVSEQGENKIMLLGTEAGALLQGKEGKLMMEQEGEKVDSTLTIPEGDEGPRLRMSKHFIECIAEGKKPLTSGLSGYTNNLILDALYESSQLGREVVLKWDV